MLGHVFVVALATILILLAVQAEPITATIGYILSGMLVLALVADFARRKQ